MRISALLWAILIGGLAFGCAQGPIDPAVVYEGGQTQAETDLLKAAYLMENKAARALLSKVPFTTKGLLSLFDRPLEMSAIEYEAFLLARRRCTYADRTGWLQNCPVDTAQQLRSLLGQRTMDPATRREIERRLALHPDARVRSMVYEVQFHEINRIARREDRAIALEPWIASLKGEQDPFVLSRLLRMTGHAFECRNYRDWQTQMLTHESLVVRKAALGSLRISQITPDEKPSLLAAMRPLLDVEDRPTVRQAYVMLGQLGDTASEPRMSKRLMEDDPSLHQACLQGLIALWIQGEGCREAYQATLDYLERINNGEQTAELQMILLLPKRDRLLEQMKHTDYIQVHRLIFLLRKAVLNDRLPIWVRVEALQKLGEVGLKADVAYSQAEIEALGEPQLKAVLDRILNGE